MYLQVYLCMYTHVNMYLYATNGCCGVCQACLRGVINFSRCGFVMKPCSRMAEMDECRNLLSDQACSLTSAGSCLSGLCNPLCNDIVTSFNLYCNLL